MPYSCNNSAEWYKACRSDDPNTFSLAYKALRQRLFSIVHYTFSNQGDVVALAEDSAQEAIYKIYDYLNISKKVIDNPNAFCSWSRTVVINKALDLMSPKNVNATPPDEMPEPKDDGGHHPMEDAVFEAMFCKDLPKKMKKWAKLTDKEIRAIMGKYCEGKSDKELAEIENRLYPGPKPVTPNTIKQRRAKGMKKLKESDYFKAWLRAKINGESDRKQIIVQVTLFRLNEGVTDDSFISVAEKMQLSFLKKQAGFIKRDLLKDEAGNWFDMIHWTNMETAKATAKRIMQSSKCRPFIELIDLDSHQIYYLIQKKGWN